MRALFRLFELPLAVAFICGTVAAADDCAVLNQYQPVAGVYPYRPLPVLTPDKPQYGVLTMDIRARRFGGPNDPAHPLQIGKYLVADVPVFAITPQGGTHAAIYDPAGKLKPIPAGCLQNADWIFGGTRWQLSQGDRIRITLTSELNYDTHSKDTVLKLPLNGSVPCRATNLHTHGFLVPPTRPTNAAGMYGDYVLDVTAPAGSLIAGKDDCGDDLSNHSGHQTLSTPLNYEIAIPGKPGHSGVWTGEHPSGLFWYHPHPHGFSRMQTAGGTTGLITIGRLQEYACKEKFAGVCPVDQAVSDMRYFELKDAQISSGPPDAVHTLLPNYGAAPCVEDPAHRRGECNFDDGQGHSGLWVFTINGVEYPVIADAKWNRGEVWRIANTSSNASYLLELENSADRNSVKQFQILAVDGVSVGQSGAAKLQSTQILLMPGSRAEVWVSPEPGQTYILHTRDISTGPSGDEWPDIDLAEIHWPAQPALPGTGLTTATQPSLYVNPPQDRAPGPAPPGKRAANPAPVPDACRFDPGDERHIYIVRRADSGGNDIFGIMAGIRRAGSPPGRVDFFDENRKVFHTPQDAWNHAIAGYGPHSPAYGTQPFSNICVLQGHSETWVVENWTGEDHNFHVHQTRFKLDADKLHIGQPEYYDYPHRTVAGPIGVMDKLIRSLIPDPNAPISPWLDAYHDSVPVPRAEGTDDSACSGQLGAANCSPGRISIHIGFLRAEQVGRFVYHCHILEHEDGGMMGEIQVCRRDDASCFNAPAAHAHSGGER